MKKLIKIKKSEKFYTDYVHHYTSMQGSMEPCMPMEKGEDTHYINICFIGGERTVSTIYSTMQHEAINSTRHLANEARPKIDIPKFYANSIQ